MSYGIVTRVEEELTSVNGLFGTSGIRADLGQDLCLDFWVEVAQAVGTRLAPEARVCVATDTRVSRGAIKAAIVSGLLASGVDASDLGILPTPALARLTQDMGFDTGIMITASHNPPQFNGIKLFNGDSLGYSKAQETEIEQVYREKRFRTSRHGNFCELQGAKERYFRFILNKFSSKDFSRSLKVVLDPGNGAASFFVSKLFAILGFDIVPVNDEPDGLFPGRNPEPKEDTLGGTIEFLRRQSADLAICFDGDADRVVFCDKEGFLGFNEMIAFISRLAIEESGKKRIATTVETGRLLDLALADLGVEVARGKVGDVNVAYLTQELEAAIGVESAGVYIMPEMGYYPDSISAALTLLSRIRRVGEIREFFRDKPQLHLRKEKLPCPNWLKAAVIDKVWESAYLFGATQLNTLDGLRFEFDNAWMLIRASGTEPAVRVIVESTSKEETEILLNQGIQTVGNIVQGLAA